MLQKIIPNKKMQKSCPEQQFASFGKEVILQKTHPQQKIQSVQNKEAKVNREVNVDKEAKDSDIKAYLIFLTGATGGARVNFFWPA